MADDTTAVSTRHTCFYRDLGEGRFEAMDATTGPWSADLQHGGPPAALLARAMTAALGRPDLHPTRMSFEILGPVPRAEVHVEASIVRAGRTITLVDAVLGAGDRMAMLARGWFTVPAPDAGRQAVLSTPDAVHEPPADDAVVPRTPAWPGAYADGIVGALDWVDTAGTTFSDLGPGGVWVRVNPPLVEGTATSPLERALVVADSAGGVGLSHDLREVSAINVDLTVFVDRLPEGPWTHLDAQVTGTPGGGSFVSSVLADRHGQFARGMQSLCVRSR